MKILLLDGYIDEPACLGVPPYVAPYVRYIYGALSHFPQHTVIYATIDQIRPFYHRSAPLPGSMRTDSLPHSFTPDSIDCVIVVSGVAVPGKYLGGVPLKFADLDPLILLFPQAMKILCGPVADVGIGEEGGKPSIPVGEFQEKFDLLLHGDPSIIIAAVLAKFPELNRSPGFSWNAVTTFLRQLEVPANPYAILDVHALGGSALITQHPNFDPDHGGNLICEIETFRGCPRFRTGGCRFCVEPLKGPTFHRSIDAIVNEIKALYEAGARHFRLGNQTDFYAYQHGDYEKSGPRSRYPRPNPEAIGRLLQRIREGCPELKTLHIDNVNALNFALYPEDAQKITEFIVHYCTPGNIAAIGVESIDPAVITQNNLKVTADEILTAVTIINTHGRAIGENGCPAFLPGLNFILGLPGETKNSLDQNYQLLVTILKRGDWLRRINIRKLLLPTISGYGNTEETGTSDLRKIYKNLRKNEARYYSWKHKVRHEIDFPLLQSMFPFGRVLRDVYAELHEATGTYLRQVGTYPLLCYVPRILPLRRFYTLIVVDHGFRSLQCLVYPVPLGELTKKELISIHGIGEKRALAILQQHPQSESEWLQIVPPDVYAALRILEGPLPNRK
jgi:radical SAM superfamily enzyme with C-terminal helix-hairpin-helix motif